MNRCSRRYFLLAAIACFQFAWGSTAAALTANAPLGRGEIVITEFFEDLFRINPATGAKTNIDPGAFSPNDHIAVDRTRQLIALDGSNQLVRFDPASLNVTPLTATTFSSVRDIAVEPSGSILVADFDNIYRVNPFNGVTTTLFSDLGVNGGFFSLRDLTVTPSGRIFATEFFEDLWEIDSTSGVATPVALSRDIIIPSLINARSDGDLILREFSTGELLRIDPDSGSVTTFAMGLPTFVRDIAIEYDDDVLVAWSEGVNRHNADTGVATTITFETPFFSPQRIAVVPVPEPTALVLAVSAAALGIGRRRRRAIRVT